MTQPLRPSGFSVPLLLLVLAACQGTASRTPAPLSDGTGAVDGSTPLAAAETPATQPAEDGAQAPAGLSVDPGSLATRVEVISQPGTPYSDAPAFGGAAPAHLALTFDQDPLSDSPLARQLRAYPVDAWRELFQAHDPALIDERIEGLKRLIADRPTNLAGPRSGQNEIPVLPIIGASQVMVAQPRVLDFAGGSGIAFVTTYAQDPQPLTNDNLFYTFQGLTADGRTWISLFYPVRAEGLPASFADSPAAADPQTFMTGFPAYLDQATKDLDALKPDQFSPDLGQLDALVKSIALPAASDAPMASASADAEAPTRADPRQAHLRLDDLDADVRLVDGRFSEVPPAGQATGGLDVTLLLEESGDLDGDDMPDAVIAVAADTGGSGRWVYLAPYLADDARPDPIPALLLGDRVQVKTLTVRDGRLTANLVVPGPNDPMCCPSKAESRDYVLDATGALVAAP